MRTSLLSGKSTLRRICLRRLLIPILALSGLMFPMSNASAQQREIVEMNNQVIRLYQSGQKTEAISLAEKTVDKSRATLGADNRVTGILLSQLGNFYREVGRYADAEKTLKTAVAVLERSGQADIQNLAGALNNLGGVYLNQDIYPEAEALFRRSLAVAERLPAGKLRDYQRGNSMNSLAVVYGNQANALADNGQTGEANAIYDKMIAMLNEVIPIWSKVFGPTNQAVAIWWRTAARPKAQLANYRVVYFATHGLVAGDVKGIGEPSLALSIPANPTEIDDGLLTSSEVAQLKLNADWVVLSACNTVAGDKPGAEALSGLARAFFYAGTRALLVSHWAVESEAATRLTTSTFDIMSKDASVGRAEALRRAMLDYLGDKSNDDNANPAYWGPFSVVGEGAVK
jgi:tetratricopeptide (TPR) repeat protein